MARRKQDSRIPTVEEIQAFNKRREELRTGVVSAEPIKAQVIRIATPPVSEKPVDQTPQTLSNEVRKMSVTEILEQNDINPIEELLAMYNEREEDPDSPNYGKFIMSRGERVSLMKEIMKYQHPTLKAVEHKGGDTDRRITVVLMMPDGSSHSQKVEQRGKVIDA